MTRQITETAAPEWSYVVEEEKAGTEITELKISPSPKDREALCQRLNLLSLDRLEAYLKLHKATAGMVVEVEGEFWADFTQACVVSLEPVEGRLHESFEAWFADPDKAVSFAKARRNIKAEKSGEVPIVEERDDPEPIIDGKIDLGELVTQYFSLSLDPYPHAEGVETAEIHAGKNPDDVPDVRKNPFAALKNWKSQQGGGD